LKTAQGPSDEISKVVILQRLIHDTKIQEIAREEQKNLLDNILNTYPCGVIVFDNTLSEIKYFNTIALKLYGVEADTLQTESITKLFQEDVVTKLSEYQIYCNYKNMEALSEETSHHTMIFNSESQEHIRVELTFNVI
jgi:PAS domain-containing protein